MLKQFVTPFITRATVHTAAHELESLRVTTVDFHRNGVGGAEFYVVLFEWAGRKMTAIRTTRGFFGEGDQNGVECFVLDATMAAAGNAAFGENSWRGDHFAAPIDQAIQAWREINDLSVD